MALTFVRVYKMHLELCERGKCKLAQQQWHKTAYIVKNFCQWQEWQNEVPRLCIGTVFNLYITPLTIAKRIFAMKFKIFLFWSAFLESWILILSVDGLASFWLLELFRESTDAILNLWNLSFLTEKFWGRSRGPNFCRLFEKVFRYFQKHGKILVSKSL